jgi:hypothetical protein
VLEGEELVIFLLNLKPSLWFSSLVPFVGSLFRRAREARSNVTNRSQCQQCGSIQFRGVPEKATAAYLSVKQSDVKRGKEGTQT